MFPQNLWEDLNFFFLVSPADNFCKQFEPRSIPTKRRDWSGRNLFETLMVFWKNFSKKMILKKISAGDKAWKFHRGRATERFNILGQKRNAAYKTYIVYGGVKPISFKRFVTVRALILDLWVPGVVPAIIGTGRNWFSSLNLRLYRSWRRVIRQWHHECVRSDIVPICQKRFLRRSIILAWVTRYKSGLRQSKTQIRLRIRTVKGTSRHMRPFNTQIRLRIRTSKVTSRHEDSDQTAHLHSKKYKSAYAPIIHSNQIAHCAPKLQVGICAYRTLRSDCELCGKLQVGICATRTLRSDCSSAQLKLQVGICAYRTLRSDCALRGKLQVDICAHRTLRSDCSSAKLKLQVGICAYRTLRSDGALRSKSYKSRYAPIDDSDQTAHPRY